MKRLPRRRPLYRGAALLLAFVMCLSTLNIPVLAAGGSTKNSATLATGSQQADGDTSGAWSDAFANNGTGYVWADKTVKTYHHEHVHTDSNPEP